MLKKRFRIYFLFAALAVLALTGCKKWLDVDAPLQVDENTVYSNEQGFRDVLNGVYLRMGNRSTYGRDMTFGLMSVLGRSYDTTISPAIGNLYYEGARYNFQDAEVKTAFKNMWEGLYQSIANLNDFLDNLESRKNIISETSYKTFKGEALGLRAFLHFDLLRMFAASPAAAGLNAPGIPYVTKVSPYGVAAPSTGAVIDSCIADLLIAKSLLSDADLAVSKFTSWAAKGLLARIYLYKGDLSNAQAEALAVINSNKFPLSTITDPDFMFTKEHMFSLYSYLTMSLDNYKSVLNTTPPLGFSVINQTALYTNNGGASSDRRRSFFDPATGALNFSVPNSNISPRKFYGTTANVLPMIRVTEMYYIAAECATARLDSLNATNLLDSVRVHRNVPKYVVAALKIDSLNIEIRKEYQKEFLGEGQMFYFYKRKNLPFSSLPFTKVPVVGDASYVFVKPE
ncbi:MAG TPA: RagB/SusD family nutrient uptake outer membrane protein [Chitinophagaceae bacterium]